MKIKDFKLGLCILIICAMLFGLMAMIAGFWHYVDSQYGTLSNITELLISKYPEDEEKIIKVIKDNSDIYYTVQPGKSNYLSLYGYEAKDFARGYMKKIIPTTIIVISILIGLLLIIFKIIKKRERDRIEELTTYLHQLNMGREVSILAHKEDSFSGLQDEIYKTVSTLYNAKEEAISVKENYANNLANIAHQMKTPLTSMSLMTQLLKEDFKMEHVEQLQKQIQRLSKLEEALLLLSRIDAGVLPIEKENVDVYTMLSLAVEGLEELSIANSCEVSLENTGIASYLGDMEWSIEAFSNLIKNCMEYAKSKVTIQYAQNPLYTEIMIWDDGEGFAKEDIAHIFQRFYRGSKAKEGGIGIGLSLAKSLISIQDGCVEAKNIPTGGGCFIVRFYCH